SLFENVEDLRSEHLAERDHELVRATSKTSFRRQAMSRNFFDLTDETAVVLGGTGVLGGAMAEALAAAGARVAVAGRNEERGVECRRRIEKPGGKAMFVSADAMSSDSLAKSRDAVIKAWGSVTVLVNG